MERVLVIGAGVVGLTCAVRLAERGHRVDVLARDLPLETTSVVAAALWYPYRALPQDRVTAWAAAGYAEFERLADDAETGVRMLRGSEVMSSVRPDPWWMEAVPRLDRVDLPGHAAAWSFVAPVIDMPRYLGWLRARLVSLGGTVSRMNLSRLPEPGHPVVDCAGLGARLLAGDHTVAPVRGQVVEVAQWGLSEWWLHSGAAGTPPTYVVPRQETVVVGGTDQEGDWSRTPDPGTAAEILERAARLVPALRDARVLRHKVGLRPSRPQVRVERDGPMVHCYGHGGAGVTLSWGCADEVSALVEEDR